MTEYEELNDDFLLALKLSEGVDQFALQGCVQQGVSGHELNEDYLLALKLSEEFGNRAREHEGDFLLALKLSEEYDQSRGSTGYLESDAAFARRLERELESGGFHDEPTVKSSMIDAEIITNVAIVREWYAGLQGQFLKITDLFHHLIVLDEAMLRERSGLRLTSEAKSAASRFKCRNNSTSSRPPGTGFSNGSIAMSGHLAFFKTPKSRRTYDPEVDRKTTAAFDFLSTNLFEFSGDFRVGQCRFVPVQTVVSALLDLSLFSETVEMILRNDSIKDLSERFGLVKSLLRALKVMSIRDEYRSILTWPRRLKKRTKGLKEIAQSSQGAAVTSVMILEEEKEPRSQPLFDLLSRLKAQAEVYLKAAKSSNDESFRVGEDAVSANLCEHLVEVHNSMLKYIEAAHPPTTRTGMGNSSIMKSPWHSTALVTPVNEHLSKVPKTLDWSSAILAGHQLSREAQEVMNILPGRQPKLVRQITELTNLPDGIFVRVMEARPDVLKALILGPKDTPYEGGFFEFDIFAPGDFPNSPPRVVLKTTGGGRVRFNPNLYANGKVCLSLINTWQGSATEKWVPGSSTLLQVLVSIQSMIFVECPYTNEPGREGLAGQLASTQHKEFVQANTIRWAMIDWLQDPSKKNGIWKDVLRYHFLCNASQLQQLVRKSAISNVAICHYNGNISEDAIVRNSTGGVNLEKELSKCLMSLN